MGGHPGVLGDWMRGLSMWRLWTALGAEDIADRYRRTAIGVVWIALSFALFVAVKLLVFGQMVEASTVEFGLFVALGFGLWTYINAMVLDACTAFIHARHWILGVSLPYPVFILQAVTRNILMFASILVVMAAAVAWSGVPWAAAQASVPVAFAAYVLTSLWLAAILAPLCARFRDLNHAAQTVMRLLFFVTPILWMPETNAVLASIARYNPIAHFIEVIREPIMHGTIPVDSWAWVVAINVVGLPLGCVVYARTRRNVVFWV